MNSVTKHIDLRVAINKFQATQVEGIIYLPIHNKKYKIFGIYSISKIIDNILDFEIKAKTAFELRNFYQSDNIKFEGVEMNENEKRNLPSGNLATFVVKIKSRQNASFQGSLQWIEENRFINFRSDFEMLKLIHEALSKDSDADNITWDVGEDK